MNLLPESIIKYQKNYKLGRRLIFVQLFIVTAIVAGIFAVDHVIELGAAELRYAQAALNDERFVYSESVVATLNELLAAQQDMFNLDKLDIINQVPEGIMLLRIDITMDGAILNCYANDLSLPSIHREYLMNTGLVEQVWLSYGSSSDMERISYVLTLSWIYE
ncbi:MAG: hypothetical protein FWG65_04720 [Turicibacter sp.]|nr:hypothetical protein [Turicibacter sp.]